LLRLLILLLLQLVHQQLLHLVVTTFTNSRLQGQLRFKMNALVLVVAHRLGFLGKRQNPVRDFKLLWAGLDVAQSIGAASKVIAVAYDKWRQLQRRTIGVNLEQSGRMGWNGR
jgi:hypothetical protein